MNGGAGPDILGVCEVENKKVLEELIGKLAPLSSYAKAHACGHPGTPHPPAPREPLIRLLCSHGF